MGVYSLIIDPAVDTEAADAENGLESISTTVKINQENVPTNHAQEDDVLPESFAQLAVTLQPLDASQLELILSRSPFRRARLTSTERVKENMAMVCSMISKWSAAQDKTMQESLSLENEYGKQQREINWQMYQNQLHDEHSYWNSKSTKMWNSISDAIQKERKLLEEIKRKELARKREIERQILEQENLEKERKESEEKERQAREEQEREDREEKEIKARLDAERREREENARQELEEKEQQARLEEQRLESELQRKREREASEEAKVQEAKQRQEAEARQRALDAIQKRIASERQEKERKESEEAKTKSTTKSDHEANNLPEPEPIVQVSVQKPLPSVTESKFVTDRTAALDDTEVGFSAVTTAVGTKELPTEPPVHQYIDEAKAEQDYYHKLILYIKSDILAPVASDKALKTYCSTNKRKVKPKLGQLTNSRQQIRKILGELNVIIDEAKEKSDLCYNWLLNFLSKSIVSQAETETTVSPMSAFPLGTLAVFMMSKHDKLRDLLIARIVKKCPYVIGYSCSIDTEEGRIRMGYKRIEGKWEDDAMYCERMGGIASVWGVMTQIGFPLNSNISHPYPLYHSWTFISRMLNLPPASLTNAHFTVMASWWELTARRFLIAYGREGQKLLTTVWDAWTRAASDRRYPAAARLRILGEQWLEHGETGLVRPEEQ
ncbi:GLE1-like protein-domain-containing protein [Lipomyces chichibuensis]|uniref:GLE1-like protein-domain-containing protein n=1 Tax=Lipomyces chichibuensis TaxID=1546026 RepID=UPI00334428F2